MAECSESVVLGGQPADELAGHHEGLLVGQADFLACADGGNGRAEAAETDHGGEHDVDGRAPEQVADGVDAREDLDVERVEGLEDLFVTVLVADDHAGRLEAPGLFDEQAAVVVGREQFHFEEVGMLPDDVQCLGTDRSGRAEDGDMSFCCFFFHQNWM